MLAPLPGATPLRVLTCQDTQLAGAGSPVLYGTSTASFSDTHGHNKQLVIVPGGFDWATSASQLQCQQHWTGWQGSSPQQLAMPDGSTCSAVCTKGGTELLMQQAGVFEQYAQALIASSYGQLSLSPAVTVLPEIYIPYDSSAPENFTYYQAPATQVSGKKNSALEAGAALLSHSTQRGGGAC